MQDSQYHDDPTRTRDPRNSEKTQGEQQNGRQDQGVFVELVDQVTAIQTGENTDHQADAQNNTDAFRQQVEMPGEIDGNER
ncbi:hypothetical protein D3C80_1813840 [compost metagenome]